MFTRAKGNEMTNKLPLDARIVLVSDSQRIPSFYVRFFDPISLISDNFQAFAHYTEEGEAVAGTADLLIAHRWFGTATRRIVEEAKERGIPIVYETDDNLLDLPKRSGMCLSDEVKDNIRAVLGMADVVVCSTRPLADRLATYNPNVQVIENYGLDKPAVNVGGIPHLAVVNTDYFKLIRSGDFFRAIERAITELNYKVTFFGSIDADMADLCDRHPGIVSIVDTFIDDRSAFLDQLAQHGINVAAVPLDDNQDHLIKSDIKFLDFASIGVPAIYNNPRVYGEVRHEVDGYVTSDNQAGWSDGFRYFAAEDNRRRCGQAAREVVQTSRGIAQYAEQYQAVLAAIMRTKNERLEPVDPRRSGLLWQSERLYLLHQGVKRHVAAKPAIASLIEQGFGLLEPRKEELALAPSRQALFGADQVRALKPSQRTSTRAPTSPASGRALSIAWIVPGLIIGGGGHRNIIRCAYHLEQLGHQVSLHFTDSKDSGEMVRAKVRKHFYPLNGHIGLLENSFPHSDFLFATHWTTVAHAERFRDRVGEIIYFVQDFEPYFYAMGSEYVLAESTYRKGFYAITSGIWCEHFLRNQYGAEADHFQFPIDRSIYFNRKSSRRDDRVLFFAKPEMPRRCFELGVQALQSFHTLRPDVEIAFYGSSRPSELSFPVTHLGVLPGPNDLAKLYNEATVGIAFSTTNPSLVPYEMMACGLPVVDLGRAGNEMNYDGRFDIARLANPDPAAMAREIADLISNSAERVSRSKEGLTFASTFPIEEDVGRRIEGLLLKRARASETGSSLPALVT
jgi:glycosyltransferase involved in cell wall biosynthesis